jgi:hypothetical protein
LAIVGNDGDPPRCAAQPLGQKPDTAIGQTYIHSRSSPSFGTPNLTLLGCLVALNEADGGSADVGGSDGSGIGGGVYSLGLFSYDDLTTIALNLAFTSNDNIFTL